MHPSLTPKEKAEALLTPRFEVIAPDTSGNWKIGDIITDDGISTARVGQRAVFALQWKSFPHLFREMAWWEKREIDEMPEYVKFKTAIPQVIAKVIEWKYESGVVFLCKTDKGIAENLWAISPSTKEEFENQKK